MSTTVEGYSNQYFRPNSSASSRSGSTAGGGDDRHNNKEKQNVQEVFDDKVERNISSSCLSSSQKNNDENIISRENDILSGNNESKNKDFLKEQNGEFFILTLKPSPEQDLARGNQKTSDMVDMISTAAAACFAMNDGGAQTSIPEIGHTVIQAVEENYRRSILKTKKVKQKRVSTPKREKEDRSDETTISASTAMLDLFHEQKDTCPERFKQLHHLGTQSLLLKKTQAYIKELQESRRMIKFEMDLQRKREEKKLRFRRSLQREDCCERLYSYSLAKQQEAKRRIMQMKQAREEYNAKPFRLYAAYRNDYVF